MSFTDEQITKLKEFIKDTRRKYKLQLDFNDHKLYDEIEGVLARLQAAESVAEELAKVHGHSEGSLASIQRCTLCPIIKVWRKSKGE